MSSAKAADLRRFLSRHAKSNGIDADTLARLPLIDPMGLRPLELPCTERAALDRRVRATDRLTQLSSVHKRRIKDLVRQLMPMTPLSGDLSMSDLAVLERYADPTQLIKAGKTRLTTLISRTSRNQLGVERAEQWLASARASIELYGGHPGMSFIDLAGLRWQARSDFCKQLSRSWRPMQNKGSSATAGLIPWGWPAASPVWG